MQTLSTSFYKTSYFNEEVNRTEPSRTVSVPCISLYLVPAVSYVAQSVPEIDHRHVGLALRVSL